MILVTRLLVAVVSDNARAAGFIAVINAGEDMATLLTAEPVIFTIVVRSAVVDVLQELTDAKRILVLRLPELLDVFSAVPFIVILVVRAEFVAHILCNWAGIILDKFNSAVTIQDVFARNKLKTIISAGSIVTRLLAEPCNFILVVKSELVELTSIAELRRTIPVFNWARLDTTQASIDSSLISVINVSALTVVLLDTVAVAVILVDILELTVEIQDVFACACISVVNAELVVATTDATLFARIDVVKSELVVEIQDVFACACIAVVKSELVVEISTIEPIKTIPVFNCARLDTTQDSIDSSLISVINVSAVTVTISTIEVLSFTVVARSAPLTAREEAEAAKFIWVLIDAVLNTKISVIEAAIVILVDNGTVATVTVDDIEELNKIWVVRSAATELVTFDSDCSCESAVPDDDNGLELIA